jgi:hypothetical protein
METTDFLTQVKNPNFVFRSKTYLYFAKFLNYVKETKKITLICQLLVGMVAVSAGLDWPSVNTKSLQL